MKTRSTEKSRITRSTKMKPKPLIFKISNSFDKEKILNNLKNLKANLHEVKQAINVTQHLSVEMIKQKANLYEKFKEARFLQKKTKWKMDYDTDEYCLCYLKVKELCLCNTMLVYVLI